MGCNCGSSRAGTSGRYNINRNSGRATSAGQRSNGATRNRAKPRPSVTSGDFVVYRRDGTETRYTDERKAVSEAAKHGLSVDWVPHKQTVTDTTKTSTNRNKK